MITDKERLIVLNAIPGLGPSRIKALIKYFGSAESLLKKDKEEILRSNVVTPPVVDQIFQFDRDRFLASELKCLSHEKVSVVTIFDNDYPEILKLIPDAPVILYVKGSLKEVNPAVALVGSRQASLYGLTVAYEFAQKLMESGIVVVSGLARGIDTSAHQGALKAQGKTIAVLGSGLSQIYPDENRDLAEKIAENGAVISEYPMQAQPLPFNFPRRNRIISGLSLGVVVVEAALKSGALITADCALEQGREVFAVPGKIDSISSGGVNNLIKQGAKLVTNVDDILEELQNKLRGFCIDGPSVIREDSLPSGRDETKVQIDLTEDEQNVLSFLNREPIAVDELVDKTQIMERINPVLFSLEMKKIVKQLPGKRYVRC